MDNLIKESIDLLYTNQMLSAEQFFALIDQRDDESAQYLAQYARIRQEENFGNEVYIRGLIEFSNYCHNNCYYCGIQKDNIEVERYRLSKDVILACCRQGYAEGFRTFVLQSGEDLFYKDEDIVDIVQSIKKEMPECAITLSIGEKTHEQYQKYYDAGADRYLLRHETASQALYQKLHPENQTLTNRMNCLKDLKEIGYQIGAGMMIEPPYQTTQDLVNDLFFLKELQPHMLGIGPFIPHHQTRFAHEKAGSVELTIYLISILRLMFPKALIPSTTALGTLDPKGREKGILAGANVIMPNLSPSDVKEKYLLYDNKLRVDGEAVLGNHHLEQQIKEIGYQITITRGDAPGWRRSKD